MVFLYVICDSCAIANYIKTLISVISEVIMVADVKYGNFYVCGLNKRM